VKLLYLTIKAVALAKKKQGTFAYFSFIDCQNGLFTQIPLEQKKITAEVYTPFMVSNDD
jgi:hypothetical protein